MNGFKCKVTGSTSNVALAKPQVPRRCGADPDNGKADAVPGNCTYGAKQPFYWFQAERNNVRWTLCIARAARGLTLVRRCSKERTRRHFTPTCTTSRTARRTISSLTRTPKFPHQARTRLLTSPHRLSLRRLRARPPRHRYRILPLPPNPLIKHRLVRPLVGVMFGEFSRTANIQKVY